MMNTIKAPIRLLVLMPNLYAGGTEKVITTLLNHLSPVLWEVHLAYLTTDKPPFFTLSPAIQQHILPQRRVRYTAWQLIALIRQLRPQLLLSVLDFTWYIALLSPFLPKETKLVTRISHLPPTPLSWGKALLHRLLYRRFQHIIVQSEWMQTFFLQQYALDTSKISVWYNPLDYSFIQQQSQLPVTLPIPKDRPIFVTVGRLASVKGHDRILKALALLPCDFVYWIIGRFTPQEYDRLWQQIAHTPIANKVVFVGEQANPYAFLRHATLYLQGSHAEGYPNALLEAQACGKPCVAYAIGGGTNEAVLNGFNGLLVENNNIAAYTHGIQQALTMPFDATSIQTFVKNKHDINRCLLQFNKEAMNNLQH